MAQRNEKIEGSFMICVLYSTLSLVKLTIHSWFLYVDCEYNSFQTDYYKG